MSANPHFIRQIRSYHIEAMDREVDRFCTILFSSYVQFESLYSSVPNQITNGPCPSTTQSPTRLQKNHLTCPLLSCRSGIMCGCDFRPSCWLEPLLAHDEYKYIFMYFSVCITKKTVHSSQFPRLELMNSSSFFFL